ncbi:hypothetical protein V8F20_006614, partial [Naviculisporaceae sp. PSN 640]
KGPEYVSYSHLSDLPACSFDFGNDGYAASCNYGGELLQMTAPSDVHGLVFARGEFEYSLYLALARGQKEKGGKSAFGLKIALVDELARDKEGPRFRPCCMVERGCFNYRWPFNEFCLHIDQKRPGFLPPASTRIGSDPTAPTTIGAASLPVGTCSLLSFVKDGVLFQVMRLNSGCQPGMSRTAELLLTVEPPMRLQSFRRLNDPDSKATEVGLKRCSKHDACVAGLLPLATKEGLKSDMHWQAHLYKLEEDTLQATEIDLKPLDNDKAKKDHCFKTKDDFDSLPRFQADLALLDTTSPHVFVAAFHLFEVKDGKIVVPFNSSQVSHAVISKFVRNGEDEAPGTASLWQTTFNNRQDKMDCVSELCEGNVVGRCLEKILRVDLVPAKIPRRGSIGSMHHFTLVSNMFLKANVDLKSLFWKVRFLVKVDHLLCKTVNDTCQATGFQCQDVYDLPMSEARSAESFYRGTDKDVKTAEATIKRIRYVLGEIAAYIVRALLMPAPSPVLLPEHHRGDPSHYYAMITLCYLVRNYPQAKWAWHDDLNDKDEAQDRNGTKQETEKGRGWSFGILGSRLPKRRDNALLCNNHAITKVKYSMLEWLHYESIFYLQSTHPGTVRIIPPQGEVSVSMLAQARLAAKTELVRRIASVHVDSYRADDEIADRLGFLAGELLGSQHETSRQVAQRITKRVEQREYTRQIGLCHPSRVTGGADDGPWETHALCHHSRLVVARRRLCAAATYEAREEAEMEVEHYRKMFYPFLTSEASLTPCWERNNSSARRGFLRSEATAVLASTIIDIFEKDVEYYEHEHHERHDPPPFDTQPNITVDGASEAGGDHPIHHESVSVAGDVRSTVHSRRGDASSMRHLRRTGQRATKEGILVQQLETLEKLANARGLERQINYLEFRPPCRYHPAEFFNSLDDTPELYNDDAIASRESSIPLVIREALAPRASPVTPGAYMSSDRVVLASDDLTATLAGREETTTRLRELVAGRGEGATSDDNDLRHLDASKAAELLRQLTVIDLATPDPLPTSKPKPIRGTDIVGVVSDSLIDQEVRHRFLLASSQYELPVGLLRLLVYVLHPEVIECFKNHKLRVSRFGLSMRPETLVLHVTLRSWCFRPVSKRRTDNTMEYLPWTATKEDDKIRLPANLLRHAHNLKRYPRDMQLHISSVGMSTNSFGDFSKCSIITSHLPQSQVDDRLGPVAQQIWDSFTHQPQAGRFLVFSLVLGTLAQAMVTHYTNIVDDFLIQTQLEEDKLPSYLQDPESLQNRDADAELRLSLWAIEALAKLSNTVSTNVTTLYEALSAITSSCQIESPFSTSGTFNTNAAGGSKLRTPELETAIHSYLAPLERAYSDLTALQTRLSRKVDLSTRYSNSLSAILALRASRDSYKQNNTIQKLTYITIGCLPIGLTAAIFAVPTEQDVINEGTGKLWFIGTVLISFVVIFAVAYWLDWLLGGLRRARDDPRGTLASIVKRKGGNSVATGTTFWEP